MSYKDLLAQYTKESGLTLRQIANECEKMGVMIDPSTISRIQTGRMPPPSEEISKAIAIICKQDPQKLIMEGYIDKAPEPIQKLLQQYMERWDTLVDQVYQEMAEDVDGIDEEKQFKTKEDFLKFLYSKSIEKQIDFIIHYMEIINKYTNPTHNEEDRRLIRIPFFDMNKFPDMDRTWLKVDDVMANDIACFKLPSDRTLSAFVPSNSIIYVDTSFDFETIPNNTLIFGGYGEDEFSMLIARFFREGDLILLNTGSDKPLIIRPEDANRLRIMGVITKVEYDPNNKETE
jgi:transcriptional regulator with XRE-family HTH domain